MEKETAKRLQPTKQTTGVLFLKSGNRCAYPGCDQPLMQADGVLVGEIAHIEAALPDGARFNGAMTNNERRAEGNLILMCATHHTVIDSNAQAWTVEKLHKLKQDHESIYTGAVDQLRGQLGDITEGTKWTSPTTLSAVLGAVPADEMPSNLEVVERFASRLARLPVGARSILALVVNRGEERPAYGVRDAEFRILWSLLRNIVDGPDDLMDLIEILEGENLAWYAEDFDGRDYLEVGRSTEGIGWPLLQGIKTASAGDKNYVRQVLVDLDFAALDDAPISSEPLVD